jgi:hypothetical protein
MVKTRAKTKRKKKKLPVKPVVDIKLVCLCGKEFNKEDLKAFIAECRQHLIDDGHPEFEGLDKRISTYEADRDKR